MSSVRQGACAPLPVFAGKAMAQALDGCTAGERKLDLSQKQNMASAKLEDSHYIAQHAFFFALLSPGAHHSEKKGLKSSLLTHPVTVRPCPAAKISLDRPAIHAKRLARSEPCLGSPRW